MTPQLHAPGPPAATDDPADRTLRALYARQVAARPHAVAVHCEAARLTYGELDRRSDAVAQALAQAGAGPGAVVALHFERSLEMVVAMLAVIKTGAAYLPLDPAYPSQRLHWMVRDARASAVVVAAGDATAFAECDVPLLELETAMAPHGDARCAPLPDVDIDDGAPAYVLYTSGSTGTPKGVVVSRASIVNLVCDTDYVTIGPGDALAHASNTSFDAATFEVWGALLNGARIVIVRRDALLDPAVLGECIASARIDVMFVTTALFNRYASVAPQAFAPLRTLLFGGEAANATAVERVRRACPEVRLLNVYGPTEATTFSTWHEIPREGAVANPVPIGRPIRGAEAHVLDESLRPVEPGEAGELCLAGRGLALGYLDASAAAGRGFVDVGLHGRSRRVYRTGDRVRLDARGDLVFEGRIDAQVKLRGHRIEPGEIEAHLRQDPSLRDAVVTHCVLPSGEPALCAHLLPRGAAGTVDTEAVRNRLVAQLPAYMVPDAWSIVHDLPLTPNGKVDRDALGAMPFSVPLPRMAAPAASPPEAAAPGVPAPGGATGDYEAILTDVWRHTLGVPRVGPDDDFFELGGHSLLAVSLLAGVEKRTGQSLRLAAFIEAPTIRAQAALLRARDGEIATPPASQSCVVPVRAQGDRSPLFMVSGWGGAILPFNELARQLGDDQPLHVLDVNAFGADGDVESLETVAARMVRDLRAVQPEGPYHLAGYSLGGKIVWAIAQQLHAQGQRVATLVIIDCGAPGYPRLRPLAVRTWLHVVHALRLSPEERRAYLRMRATQFRRLVDGDRSPLAGRLAGRGSRVREAIERSAETLHRAWQRYAAPPWHGDVTIIRADVRSFGPGAIDDDPCLGWWPLVRGSVHLRRIACRHTEILDREHIPSLAALLQASLR